MKWKVRPYMIGYLILFSAMIFGCYQEYNTEVNTDTTVIKTINEKVDPALLTYAYYEKEWSKLSDSEKYKYYPREIHFITAYDGFTCPPCEQAKAETIAKFRKAEWRIQERDDYTTKNPILKIVQGRFPNDPVYFGYGVSAYPTWIIYHRTEDGKLIEESRITGFATVSQLVDKFYAFPLADPEKTGGILDGLTGIEIEGYKQPYNNLIDILKEAIDKEYTLNGAASIDLPENTELSLSRKEEGIQILFLDRKPQARILSGWVKTRITSIQLNKDHAIIYLTTFPKLTIYFK